MNSSTKHLISCQSVDVLESGRGRGITGGPRILVTTELGAKYKLPHHHQIKEDQVPTLHIHPPDGHRELKGEVSPWVLHTP